jgi:hypothetical protein
MNLQRNVDGSFDGMRNLRILIHSTNLKRHKLGSARD